MACRMIRPILVDVDAGSDDAWALMVILALEKKTNVKVVGITCTHGNTSLDNVCRNVLLTIESMDRTDVPVFKGAESSIISDDRRTNVYWHGENGFGNCQFDDPKIKIQQENAVNAIKQMSMENPGLIVIALGPLTNIALALKIYPELNTAIDELWIMGGNKEGVGNMENTTAEFNFGMDPEAARIVVNSGIQSITMLPWEPCIESQLTKEWRFETLGLSTKKHMLLMNEIDKSLYGDDSQNWNPCDALLMAAFLDQKAILKARKVHMQVELQGTWTRGQCVLLEKWRPPNVRIIDELDYEVVREIFIEASKYS